MNEKTVDHWPQMFMWGMIIWAILGKYGWHWEMPDWLNTIFKIIGLIFILFVIVSIYKRFKYHYDKVKAEEGMYNNPENSQIIAIDNPKQRALIDKRLEKHSKQQENMIVKNWYAYRYDPRTNEAYKVDLKKADIDLPAETDNFYSEIDGRKYQLPLYWELEQPITVEEFLSIYNS